MSFTVSLSMFIAALRLTADPGDGRRGRSDEQQEGGEAGPRGTARERGVGPVGPKRNGKG